MFGLFGLFGFRIGTASSQPLTQIECFRPPRVSYSAQPLSSCHHRRFATVVELHSLVSSSLNSGQSLIVSTYSSPDTLHCVNSKETFLFWLKNWCKSCYIPCRTIFSNFSISYAGSGFMQIEIKLVSYEPFSSSAELAVVRKISIGTHYKIVEKIEDNCPCALLRCWAMSSL